MRSHSSASLSLITSNLTNGHHHGHAHAKSGIHHSASSTPISPSGLNVSSSSGNLQTGKVASRPGVSSTKIYTSASGNHLAATAVLPQSNGPPVNNSEATNTMFHVNDAGDLINNSTTSTDPGSGSSSPAVQESPSMAINHFFKINVEDSGSGPRSKTHSLLPRSQADNSLDLDLGSLENESSHGTEMEMVDRRKSAKKKTNLIPKFLQKSKRKQKTS